MSFIYGGESRAPSGYDAGFQSVDPPCTVGRMRGPDGRLGSVVTLYTGGGWRGPDLSPAVLRDGDGNVVEYVRGSPIYIPVNDQNILHMAKYGITPWRG